MKGSSAFDFGPSSNRTKRKVQGLKGVGVNKQTLANKWQPYNTVSTSASNPHTTVQKEYTGEELQQFISFFPSHFTLTLPGSSLRFRHILDEVVLSLQSTPRKYRAPHYNLLGFLYSVQGNSKIAFRYFREVVAVDENNILSIANQAHCYLRKGDREKALKCLKKLMSLTYSANFINVESQYMSDAKAELGYAYSAFGLSNAARRMFECALQYNSNNLNACFGLAHTLLSVANHENRSRRNRNLKKANNLLKFVLKDDADYVAARALLLLTNAEMKRFSSAQLKLKLTTLLNGKMVGLISALVFRDLALIQMAREEYTGEMGALHLLDMSLKQAPSSDAYFLLGRSHYLSWYKENKSITGQSAPKGGSVEKGPVSETDMLIHVKAQYEEAVTMSYSCRLDIILALGLICSRLADVERATQLLKQAVNSEDISVQECGFRHLALLESQDSLLKEVYLRESLRRLHLVKMSKGERREFWDFVYRHAEYILQERGASLAFPWITALVENQFSRADTLVDLYNKENLNNPMTGLSGEISLDKKTNSRKTSKSKLM